MPIQAFAIERVGPNPTSKSAVIGFAIPRQAPIRLSVFDAQGREVAVPASGSYAPGRYSVTWSGEGRSGRLAAGMYFIRFQTPDLLRTRRLVLKR